jgi:uncharacterized protein (DUF1015 family)
MSFVHPIHRAWLGTAGTGARNYDEFASDEEITAIVRDNPHSALAVEMPHLAPESLGRSFVDALPDAAARLEAAKREGRYLPAEDVVVLYRITDPATGRVSHGLFAMVDTDEISTSPEEPGRVIRNEDVFVEKVRERVALGRAVEHLLSPVLLLQTATGDELAAALAQACVGAGEPALRDTDHVARTHEVWPLPDGETARRLLDLAAGGELVVADGNHRSLAAQTAGLPRFLAVVTAPACLDLQPYHRLLAELPVPVETLLGELEALGAEVTADVEPDLPEPGTVVLYAGGRAWAVRLPAPVDAAAVDRLDHALVEDLLFGRVLGWEPGDKRIRYIGGDYPVSWLREQVDDGLAALAVVIAPVRVSDFVEVNLARQKMPRKSTWFTPKARAGLVLAELDAAAATAAAR